MAQDRHTVFCYGTLKRGHGNNHLVEGGFVSTALTAKLFSMVTCGFPVALQCNKTARIAGEVYEVSTEQLARLDTLEGEGRMYKRRRVLVLTRSGVLKSWMYVGIAKHWHGRFHEVTPTPSPLGLQYTWGEQVELHA